MHLGCGNNRRLVPLFPPAAWNRVVKPIRSWAEAVEIQIAADEQRTQAQVVQAAFVKARQLISQGEIPDGGDRTFDSGSTPIEVNAGEVILLSVTPLKNNGADTTLVEFELTEFGGQMRKWNATADLVGDLLAGNPHADGYNSKSVWWFLTCGTSRRCCRKRFVTCLEKPGCTVER